MSDLVEFLNARLDEDEQAARDAEQAHPPVGWMIAYDPETLHTRRHDPARVLAEVDAKRRTLAEHHPEGDVCRTCTTEDREVLWDGETETVEWVHRSVASPCLTLRLLAFPYADHPEYQETWKP